MRLLFSIGLAASLCIGISGISRDGTLPARLTGVSIPVPNNGNLVVPTEVRIFQTHPEPGIAFNCGLRGTEIESTSIAGELDVGEQRFNVIGTCFNPATNAVEVITEQPGTRLQGRLTGDREVNLKGVIKLHDQTFKFELK